MTESSQSAADSGTLTERQKEILRLVGRRAPYKEIAAQLSISETRVAQHVAAIKRKFGLNSLQEVHALASLLCGQEPDLPDPAPPFMKGGFIKKEVPEVSMFPSFGASEMRSSLLLNDVAYTDLSAPWESKNDGSIVPKVLAGSQGGWVRLLVVLGLALAILSIVLVGLAVAQALTDISTT